MERSEELAALIQQRIEESVAVKQALLSQRMLLAQLCHRVVETFKRGNKLLLFGNGGSASDAQHIAAEFVGRYRLDRKPLPAEALTTNLSSLTAIGNDYSFDEIFARQIDALGSTGDLAVAISTSGNSENVIRGVQAARRKVLFTVGLTGENGGRLKADADLCICVPSKETARIQESHILIGHILSEIVESSLFDREHRLYSPDMAIQH